MISMEKIRSAHAAIKDTVVHTPLFHSPSMSHQFAGDLYLKMENLQRTGSFKIRGALNKLSQCLDRIGSEGVVAASAGNHAQGVALAASKLGISSTIVMPDWASISKQVATKNYGGHVMIHGQSIDESLEKARELARMGKFFVHPYDDEDIIAGQATAGLEILEDLPDTGMIIVPVGGGGLISGIASAAKAISPGVKIIGVQAVSCPSAVESGKAGKPVTVSSTKSIADGISVKKTGDIPFDIIQSLVDDIVLVEEDEIAGAVLMLLELRKIVAEGSGAAPLAALLSGKVKLTPGVKTVLFISGGNVDSPLLGRILRQGLINKGRLLRFEVNLDDVPGALSALLSLVAKLDANVLHIYHDRHLRDLPIYRTRVDLELETRSRGHTEKIIQQLKQAGYDPIQR